MNKDQERAFDFVVSLRDFYGDYRSKKEREAYGTAVLYLGATVAALKKIPSDDLPNRFLVEGLALRSSLIASARVGDPVLSRCLRPLK